MMYTCRGEEYIYTLQQKFNAGNFRSNAKFFGIPLNFTAMFEIIFGTELSTE